MLKRTIAAAALLAAIAPARADTSPQFNSLGGMQYYLLPASGGCSAATPCSVVTYLSVQSESQGATLDDLNNYFGGAFAQANPHTVVIAPVENGPQDADNSWGGYDKLQTTEQQQMVSIVESVEQSMGNTVNPKDSVVTGGSLGGTGTQAAVVAYGPKGTVQPGVFSAGLSFDAALWTASDPAEVAALCGVPLTAVHGTADTNQSISYDQNLQSQINSNPACGNSFTLDPVQGAGHGTWGGPGGYQAGTGNGTPLGWLTSQLQSAPATPAAATTPTQTPTTLPATTPEAASSAPAKATTPASQLTSAATTIGSQPSTAIPASNDGCTVPGPASEVGYDTETYAPDMQVSTQAGAQSFPAATASAPLTQFSSFGTSWTQVGYSQSGNSVTTNGTGEAYGNGLTSMSQNGSGVAFGGGGYFQVTMSGDGPMSFWANDIEHQMNGQSGSGGWIETDFAEFDSPNVYGGAVHNWTNTDGSGVSTLNSGSPFQPAGANYSQPNTYGFLWVPATATSQGYAKWFFNGQQVGNTMTWNQFQPGQSAQANPYAALDQLHLALILGSEDGSATFSNLQVWQANGSNDVGTLSGSAQSATPCPNAAPASNPAPQIQVANTTGVSNTPTADTAPAVSNTSAPSTAPIGGTAAPASGQQAPTASPTLSPGTGSVTDCSGNVWAINSDDRITENDALVAGGGDTASLSLSGCTVYGKDNGDDPNRANAGGWFTKLSVTPGSGQVWQASAAPPASGEPSTGGVPAQSAAVTPGTQPVVNCGTGVTTGQFHVQGGAIINPNGTAFVARGINIYGDFGPMTAGQLATTTFRGVNMIRYIVRTLDDPTSFDAFATMMTQQGIVVEFEHHPDGGGGQDAGPPEGIPLESAWYANMAKHFANNPYVWFGTFNEPAATPALSPWQQATYNAVRSGSNTILLVEVSGSRPYNLQQALTPSTYASMHNIVWDVHVYGYQDDYNPDPAAIDADISGMISAAQTIQSADGVVPVLIGESGPSTTGQDLDANGYQVVQELINIAQKGTMGGLAQFTWYPGFASPNNLTDAEGNTTSPYGEMAKLYIGVTRQSCTAAQTQANAQNTLETAQAAVTGQPATTGQTTVTDQLNSDAGSNDQASQGDTNAAATAAQQQQTTAVEQDTQQQVDTIQSQLPAVNDAITASQQTLQSLLATKAAQQ